MKKSALLSLFFTTFCLSWLWAGETRLSQKMPGAPAPCPSAPTSHERPQSLPRPAHGKILFTRSFSPFFLDHSSVPYALKLQLEKSFPQLKKFLSQPGTYLRIQGFSSAQEHAKTKRNLAKQRARAVSRYLVWKGKLSKAKIQVLASKMSKETGRKTRRVTIQVVKN